MTEIRQLMDHIEAEIEDAHAYATLALEYRDADKATADLYYDLSTEEMSHMRSLHKAVERLIESYRRQKGDPPAAMLAVYQHLHARFIKKSEQVGVLQGMYQK